jgi:DNA repair photolyase
MDEDYITHQIYKLQIAIRRNEHKLRKLQARQDRKQEDISYLKKLQEFYEAQRKEIVSIEESIPELKNQKILRNMEKRLERCAEKGVRYYEYSYGQYSGRWEWENDYYKGLWDVYYKDYIKEARKQGVEPKDYTSHKYGVEISE